MLKKRLIGVVTVRQGWAVQSFNYSRYLPLGKPEVLVENLDRWGADEILIQCIDRSLTQAGPDFNLLNRLSSLGLSTPLIYAGGIRHVADAIKVVSLGADRISVDSILWDAPQSIEIISRELGTQALIGNMPVCEKDGSLFWKNYRSNVQIPLTAEILATLPLDWISEVMLTDWIHEGVAGSFDQVIPTLFPQNDKPLIVFGGLSEFDQYKALFSQANVVAVGVGNTLNYKEHAVQQIKQRMAGLPIRSAHYALEVSDL
jgi:cyclase